MPQHGYVSQTYVKREIVDKKDTFITGFHLYEVLEQLNLIYNDRNQISGCLEWVQAKENY